MGIMGTCPERQTLYTCCSSDSNSVQTRGGQEWWRKGYGKPGLDPSLPPASGAVEPEAWPSPGAFPHPQAGAVGAQVPKGLQALSGLWLASVLPVWSRRLRL